MLWMLANNFDEYGYSLRRDLNDDRGYASFIDLMKFVSKYDNVLFVFDLPDGGEGGTGAKVGQVVIDGTAVNGPEI